MNKKRRFYTGKKILFCTLKVFLFRKQTDVLIKKRHEMKNTSLTSGGNAIECEQDRAKEPKQVKNHSN